ncbi:MAG TPA: cupredoxin domain-containing protein [Mycobacteriales bacterium]|jgi:plastocyanin|nr:cupredoxin domain-containing protein [Mycobacteriales bacterium]
MTRRLAAVLLFLAAALALPAPAFAATATVTIDSTLHPKSLTVAPGTTVTWRNAGTERHRVRTTSAPVELDSNDLDPGQSWSFTFRTAGTYRYVDHRNEDEQAYWGSVTVATTATATSPPPGGGGTGGGGTGGGTTAPSAPATGTVHLAGRAFSPSSISVAAGGTITFVNDDDRAHTVTADDGSFDSGVLNAGSRYPRRFASAGTFRYHCAIHPDMTGTVTVPSANGAVPPPRPAAAPRAATGTTATGNGAAAPPGPGAARPGSARVTVVDFAFRPGRVAVHVGDTVTWANAGQSPHTVTAGDGSFGTSMLLPGATYRTVARKVGSTAYVCQFHPQMTGTLVVLPANAALPPAAAAAPPPAARPRPRAATATAAPATTPPAATTPGEEPERRLRAVATSMWGTPIVAWTLWGGLGLVAFLAVAWWRGREVTPG